MYKDHYTASYALVIGINNYKDVRITPLSAAESDARQVAEVLSAVPYEFDVNLLLGDKATRSAITTALEDLYRVDPDARIIFYFAGHGYGRKDRYDSETGYLQVYDSLKGRDLTALRMIDVTELGRRSNAKHIAFIVDACSSALVLTATRGDEEEIPADKLIISEARQVLSAAVEKATDHPSMTTFLLNALKNDSLNSKTGLYIFDDLAHDVLSDIIVSPAHMQKPVYGPLPGTEGGQLIFRQGINLDPNLRKLLDLLHSPFEGVSQGALHDLLDRLDDPEHGGLTYETLEAIAGNERYPRILEVLEAHRQRQIERVRAEIDQLIEENNWQAAREALDELKQLDPAHPELQSLEQAIETGERADDGVIQSLVGKIERRIKLGHISKAREYLDELKSADPEYPDLSNLAWRIDQRKIEIKIQQARRYLADGDLPPAEKIIEKIFELDPEHSEAHALRNEISRQQHYILGLVSKIEEQITHENWSGARQKLNLLKQAAPNYSGLGEFERVIEAGELAKIKRIEYEEYIQSLVDEIERQIQAGNFNKARELLSALKSAAPQYHDLSNLAWHVDQCEIEIKLEQARRYIAEGNFSSAEKVIERIFELDPDHSEAHALRNEISRRRDISGLVSEIEAQIKASNWSHARQKLDRLKQIALNYPGLGEFERVIEAGERAEQEPPGREARVISVPTRTTAISRPGSIPIPGAPRSKVLRPSKFTWKKALWMVAALYPVGVVFIMLANAESDATILSLIPGFLMFLLPLGVLIFELRDGKTPKIWGKINLAIAYLVSFLLLGVGTVGYYSFNTPTMFNLVKGLPLLITLLALFYIAFRRIFK